MGGQNQATCPPASIPAPAPDTPVMRAIPEPQGADIDDDIDVAVTTSAIRFHEDTQNGEVHFHNDADSIKCAIDSAEFFKAYHKWRDGGMSHNLCLMGHDGSGGQTAVKIFTYFEDKVEVGILVQEVSLGQTITDLDKLASY